MEHPKLACLRRIEAIVDELGAFDCWSLSADDVTEYLDRLAVLQARLVAEHLAAVAHADSCNVGAAEATSTAGWLRGRLLVAPGQARAMVRLARELRSDCWAPPRNRWTSAGPAGWSQPRCAGR